MRHPYKWALVVGFFVVPLVVIVAGGAFGSGRLTLLRGLAATAAGWAWLVAGSLLVTELDIRLALSPEQVEAAVRGDGSRHVGAVLFGWAPALLVVVLYWGVARVARSLTARGSRA